MHDFLGEMQLLHVDWFSLTDAKLGWCLAEYILLHRQDDTGRSQVVLIAALPVMVSGCRLCMGW